MHAQVERVLVSLLIFNNLLMSSSIIFKIFELRRQSRDRPDDVRFYNSALAVIILYSAAYIPVPLTFELLRTRFPQILYIAPGVLCQLNVGFVLNTC